MKGHNICFKGVMWKIIPKLSLVPLLIWSTGHSFESTCIPIHLNTSETYFGSGLFTTF